MKITTRAVYDMASGELLEWEGYDYNGSLELCGGGPSPEQRAAAATSAAVGQNDITQGNIANQRVTDEYNTIKPFETALMTHGLPFLNQMTDFNNGISARNAIGARANLLRSIGGYNQAQPNGMAAGLLGDLENSRARDFDSNQLNAMNQDYNARQQAASLLTNQQQLANPLGWSQAASSTENNIMQAPLQQQSPLSAVGGLVGGLGGAALGRMKPWG